MAGVSDAVTAMFWPTSFDANVPCALVTATLSFATNPEIVKFALAREMLRVPSYVRVALPVSAIVSGLPVISPIVPEAVVGST